MTTLLIDIGNSYLKWGLDDGLGFAFGGSCRSDSAALETMFEQSFTKLNPDHVFLSCVSNHSLKEALIKEVRNRWQQEAALLVASARACGINNAYTIPENLGSDRWAAMIAGFQITKGPVCVVSCGTAVTLDAVNADGEHLGGLIVPGFRLMSDCLRQGTNMSFANNFKSTAQVSLGQSTENCIWQGTSLSIGSMVNEMFESLRSRFSEMRLILTGGDAEILIELLHFESSIESHLVLRGMSIIHRTKAGNEP